MYCQNCGKEVDEKDRFCKNCGILIGYTREEETPVQQAEQNKTVFSEEEGGQAVAGNPEFQEQPPQQEFVSFSQDTTPQTGSSKKTITWIIVGVVALVGLITLILLAVLVGAARRKAKPRLRQWNSQIQEEYDDYGNSFDFDYDDYDDEDEEDERYFEPDIEQFF